MNFSFFLPDFSYRISLPELMDDHKLGRQDLYVTLRHFFLINRLFSRTTSLFRRFIFQDIKRRGLKSVTIMDIGAGGGDFARYCVKFFKKQEITAKIICLDNDPRIVSYLETSCKDYPSLKIISGSALDLVGIKDNIDYCISNNVLHHFEDSTVPEFIIAMYDKAQYGILINDLARTAFTYIGFKVFAGIFFRTGLTLKDGLLSIRKGFTVDEIRSHVQSAGLINTLRIGRSAVGNIFITGTKS
jgi:2-polyprenyl-3-methyl-5-hydroxy-6-metoxy-1,4-benzoquinol methylase